jgi:hypothetical protein
MSVIEYRKQSSTMFWAALDWRVTSSMRSNAGAVSGLIVTPCSRQWRAERKVTRLSVGRWPNCGRMVT